MFVHNLVVTLLEQRGAPAGREREFLAAARLVTHGPFARRHWAFGVALGTVAPLLLLALPLQPAAFSLAAALGVHCFTANTPARTVAE